MIEEIKAKAKSFLESAPDNVKENPAFEDFLRHLGVEVRNAFREVWLERDARRKNETKEDDKFRVLGE